MRKYPLTKDDKELISKAKEVIKKSEALNMKDFGEVGSALVTNKGNFYIGISLGFYCGISTCGEYQAVGSMMTSGETLIETIVAVSRDNKIMPPCGKCREMLYQVNKKNLNTFAIISNSKKIKLKDLLPLRWQELW